MDGYNCEFANIESLRGEDPPPSEMAINSTFEYQRMEGNNHTSADIKSAGRGKFSPYEETGNIALFGENFEKAKSNKWKEIIVNLKKLKITHDKYFENGKK